MIENDARLSPNGPVAAAIFRLTGSRQMFSNTLNKPQMPPNCPFPLGSNKPYSRGLPAMRRDKDNYATHTHTHTHARTHARTHTHTHTLLNVRK